MKQTVKRLSRSRSYCEPSALSSDVFPLPQEDVSYCMRLKSERSRVVETELYAVKVARDFCHQHVDRGDSHCTSLKEFWSIRENDARHLSKLSLKPRDLYTHDCNVGRVHHACSSRTCSDLCSDASGVFDDGLQACSLRFSVLSPAIYGIFLVSHLLAIHQINGDEDGDHGSYSLHPPRPFGFSHAQRPPVDPQETIFVCGIGLSAAVCQIHKAVLIFALVANPELANLALAIATRQTGLFAALDAARAGLPAKAGIDCYV